MNNHDNMNSLDEALRIIWLESSKDADITRSEREIKKILNSESTLEMSEDKELLMMNALRATLSTQSFGEVLTAAMSKKGLSTEPLSISISLPLEVVQDLTMDKIFINNIPIMLFKSLLKQLDLSFSAIEKSIWKTFRTLKSNEYLTSGFASQASFRRSHNNSRDSFMKLSGMADGKELFENEDALKKYLSKLETLM